MAEKITPLELKNQLGGTQTRTDKLYSEGTWSDVIVQVPVRDQLDLTQDGSVPSSMPLDSSENMGEASKEYKMIEKYTLVGEADVIPDTKLRSKVTVKFGGLGRMLSGLYYVEQVRRTWGRNGFSQSISVSRNALGESIKIGLAEVPIPEAPSTNPIDPERAAPITPIQEIKQLTKLSSNKPKMGDVV